MTEDEAKAKVCCGPPAVAIAQIASAFGVKDVSIACQGSTCMAWRSGYTRHLDEGLVQVVRDGYCGLAGAPQ